jgi:peptide/nickel transport system permease protein
MRKVIISRLLRLAATLLAVTFLTFSLTSLLPGDPVNAILGVESNQDPELVQKIRDDLGLDDPFLIRYGNWLWDAVVHFDLGESYINRGQSVSGTIMDRIPVTGQLAFMAIIMAVLMAVPIGVIGAYKQGKWQDTVSSAGVQVALSIPNFIMGIFFIWLFAVQLQWLPSSNWNRISDKGLLANLETAIMPAAALAMTQMAIFSRLVRADMVATLQENYILAAKAKGLNDRFILMRHALRPSSLSLMTIVGINFGALLGGTVVIETLFAVPGLGFRLINAINQRDILVIQGITVFVAAVYVIINTIVDLLYAVIDPRIRKG